MTARIIKKESVQIAAAPARVPGHPRPGTAAHAGAKAVRLIDEGGAPRAIELVCSCGELTRIEIEYPAPEGAGPHDERKVR